MNIQPISEKKKETYCMMNHEEYQVFLKERFTAAGEVYVKKTADFMKKNS